MHTKIKSNNARGNELLYAHECILVRVRQRNYYNSPNCKIDTETGFTLLVQHYIFIFVIKIKFYLYLDFKGSVCRCCYIFPFLCLFVHFFLSVVCFLFECDSCIATEVLKKGNIPFHNEWKKFILFVIPFYCLPSSTWSSFQFLHTVVHFAFYLSVFLCTIFIGSKE